MFDIGWTEMLVIAVIMIVVVGPKDLPGMLRTFGKTTSKLRSMAGDFKKQFNDALKEAELDDVKKSVDALRGLNPANEIKKQLNPFEKAASDVRAGLDSLKPAPQQPASPVAVAAEPLKNGAAAMPGDGPALPVASDVSSAPAAVGGPVATQPEPKPRKPRVAKTPAATTEATKPKAAPRKKKSESSPT